MEKDIDEVGKIARGVKAKLEAINRDVLYSSILFIEHRISNTCGVLYFC